jgi:hypothetical protein
MRSPAAFVAFVLILGPACSSSSTHTVDRPDSAGAGAADSGGGGGGATDSGTGGSGGPNSDGGGIAGIDCPGARPCTRTAYRIPEPVVGITQMDPYAILELAVGPDTALTQQTANSDDLRTAGAETYLFFALSCPAVREYGVTWEGRAGVNSSREVLVAVADGTYVPSNDWPTERVTGVPTDSDVKETIRGLVPDDLGNLFVRINTSDGGDQYTDWLVVGSCI